ncbi:MAG: ccr4 associated factor [Thelocarpon impressellum]|nr:MAG: ccr4 associated factor [Thelocarpon impressellum]
MYARPPAPFVCRRCLARRRPLSTSAAALAGEARPPPPPPPLPSGAARLRNRRLISVHGQDAPSFLQGLTTNSLRPEQTRGIYSAFLTAQGRILDDVFIYPTTHAPSYTATLDASLDQTDPGYLVEVDDTQALRLLTHLKRHKLRARLKLQLLEPDEWAAWSVWERGWTSHPHPDDVGAGDGGGIGCVDGRAPGLGRRLVLPYGQRPEEVDEASLESYTVRRILHGVPEGAAELVPETSLPQESNVDLMGGVDFRKGCYVGQELTIRTHHTGVVRKRILPVRFYPLDQAAPGELHYDPSSSPPCLPPPGTSITRNSPSSSDGTKKSGAGRFLAGTANLGLALCRLEAMTDLRLPGAVARRGDGRRPDDVFAVAWHGEGGRVEGRLGVRAFVPGWWPMERSP